MKDIIKLFTILILRFLLKLFYIFPVNKQEILFSSFEGKQYSCNPKYLFKKIIEQFSDKYKYIWVINNRNSEDFKRLLEDISEHNSSHSSKINVKTVRFFSIRHFYYYLTAKYIISNLNIEPVVPKRKNQIYLATWHASGAYKNMDFSSALKPTAYKLNARDFRAKKIDYYVAGCRAFKDVYIKTWNTDSEHFIESGLPRNDIFFLSKDELKKKKQKILGRLNLSEDCSYILFAPTYRGLNNHRHKSFDFQLDVHSLIEVVKKRFNRPFNILKKYHVDTKSKDEIKGDDVIDVSWYSDMQELLILADILITDYSSSIWDFALLKKPCFLYTPDLSDYLHERGFYTKIEDWPFDYASSNRQLQDLILNYDSSLSDEKIKRHFNLLGSYDAGNAAQSIIRKIGL